MPRISIVIPFRDRFPLLERCLKSIQLQDQELEVILVDDNSSEGGLKDCLQQFKSLGIKYIRNERRMGPGASRNKGVDCAKGTYICFLDADDFWKKNFLNTGASFLDKNTEAAGCILLPKNIYDRVPLTFQIKARFFSTIKLLTLMFFYLFNKRQLMPAASFVTQVSHMMFRRSHVQKFREDLAFAEDWWMVMETSNKGPLMVVPQQLAFYYFTPTSYTWEKQREQASLKILAYNELLGVLEKKYPKNIFTFLFRIYSKNLAINKQA